MCRINEVLLMKKGDIQLGLKRRSRESGNDIHFGCFTIRDRKTDHDPLASRTYSLHHLPKEEQAAEALTHLERWFEYARVQLHHNWRDSDYAFPSLTKIPRGVPKRQKCSETTSAVSGRFDKVGIKWASPMSDNNFTQVLNIVADAAGISKNILGDEIWFTSHCFRRGGAQYRFMFAPEKRRWSLKLVKWWAGWAPSEKAETVTRYLLDEVLDREENQLGDSLAPDSISYTSVSLRGLQDMDYEVQLDGDDEEQRDVLPIASGIGSETIPASIVCELKNVHLNGLREVVNDMGIIQCSTRATDPEESTELLESTTSVDNLDTTHMVSELPDAKTWRDYVDQYWKPNPACHQYRAGVDMLPHERKLHRSRLSRMKIIAEYIRAKHGDDRDSFESSFTGCVQGKLTVNKILTAIRKIRRS